MTEQYYKSQPQVDTRSSQGFLNQPSGPVTQKNINTQGGDYADGNIDKRSGTFIFAGDKSEALERRKRRAMLERARNDWVKGVLEQSLHGVAQIELGMEYKPEAVQYPWATILQQPDKPAQPLPPGTKIAKVFDEVSGELLILGAPGSGKTTMLLDLARDLIARAEQDETYPIPAVFNLSSWARKRPPLADWLVDEICFRYHIPKKIAQAWVNADNVLPLLDGLDEVKESHRAECVEAINHFRQERGLLATVVCSRIRDYEALNAQLQLRGAILLQPLTRGQADGYLESAGEQLASARAMLKGDAALQELAKSPLMLSIIALTYQGVQVDSYPQRITGEERRKHSFEADEGSFPAISGRRRQDEERRKHLFKAYVERMFKRPNRSGQSWQKHTWANVLRQWFKRRDPFPNEPLYASQQTIHWLSWLARRMVDHSQTTFYLERMQLDWLPPHFRGVHTITTGVFIGLFIGLVDGLVLGLFDGSVNGPITGFVNGLVNGLIFGLANGLVCGLVFGLNEKIEAVKTLRWLWRDAKGSWLFSGLVMGLINGPLNALVMMAGLSSGVFIAPIGRFIFGSVFGGVCGVLIIGLFGKPENKVEVVEKLHWSWRDATGGRLFIGLFIGLFSGLAVGLINFSGLLLVFVTLSTGLIGGLVGGLVGGLKIGGEIEAKTIPNQGVWRSARNAILSGLFIGLFVELFIAPVDALVFGWVHALINGLLYALTFGLLVGLLYGGFVCIQHVVLRLMLYRNGSISLNYVRFLDYCAERVFLRKVGGGYIFVHRLLMEYFEELETEG